MTGNGCCNTMPTTQAESQDVFLPEVDILEMEDQIQVRADVPGADASRIDLEARDGVLTLHAPILEAEQRSGWTSLRQEYGVGDYRRRFRLGEDIDVEGITASYAEGVLTVTLPRIQERRGRKIEVSANDSAS